MKKNLFMLAVAGLALASCSNDETVASQATSAANEISFRPLMTGVTRAISATTISDFTADHSFFAAAYKNDDHSQYFAPDEFKSISSSNYRGSKTYYWPSFAIDFIAWYPNDAQLTHSAWNQFTFVPSTTAAEHKDFIIAANMNQSKATPVVGVPLAFKHLGSWIEVKVYNSKGTAQGNLDATVSGWKIGYLHKGGIYTIATSTANGTALPTSGGSGWSYTGYDAVNASNEPAEYKVASLASNFVSGLTGTYDASGEAVSIGEVMIVPQATTKMNSADTKKYNAGGRLSGAFIALKLKIVDSESNTLVDATGVDGSSKDLWAIWPINNDWAAGTKYTYTIDVSQAGYKETGTASESLVKWFDGAEIFFSSVTVTGWGDAVAGAVSFD